MATNCIKLPVPIGWLMGAMQLDSLQLDSSQSDSLQLDSLQLGTHSFRPLSQPPLPSR